MPRQLANIIQLGIKELRSLMYDKVMLILVIYAFSLGIYIAATSASVGLHNAPIAVVDEDRSPLSGRIINGFYGPYFRTPDRLGVADIDPSMDAGIYTFVLDIPPNFQNDVLAGKQPALQANIDATRMTQAFIGAGYIRNIVTGEVNEFVQGHRAATDLPIELATRVKFNPNLTGLWFGGVMEIINNITMLSIILTGAALIREREHGTIEHLLVMPLTAFEIMAAKVWANGLIVLVAAGLSLLFVVQGLLNVPIAGSVPLFLFGAVLHLFSTTAMGIYMGTVARSMPQFGLLMILVIIPLQLLSGGVTPRESMPDIVQMLMLAAPTTHFVNFAQAILYRGAGFDVVWPGFLAIIAIGGLFFLATLARFRQSVGTLH
ncbi:MAG: ABC transporter permease [Gammaproteobacteria bacterium]|nr:ABC transporter permease [Gammaproteobacteria bacterium]